MILEFEDELGELYSIVPKERSASTAVQPLAVGDKAPFFSLNNAYRPGASSVFPDQSQSVVDLTDHEPLVVSFYCPCWGRYARPYLEGLIALAERLRAEGLHLLVFSNEPVNALLRQYPQLNFMVAYDADFTVARRFGVYSEESPIWDRVSGISEEVFTPALYVIGPNRQIGYRFLDEDFDQVVKAGEVVEAAVRLRESA